MDRREFLKLIVKMIDAQDARFYALHACITLPVGVPRAQDAQKRFAETHEHYMNVRHRVIMQLKAWINSP